MTKVRISAIVAIDQKRGMGKEGGIPWHIPGEQKRFKEITTPHPMIMGRKTFISIGRVLPGRPNIVISRQTSVDNQDIILVSSLQEALEKAKGLEELRIKNQKSQKEDVILNEVKDLDSSVSPQNDMENEVFIIGGGEIFKESIQYLDRLYLTIIEKDFDCDTFFPDYSNFTKVIEKEEHTYEDFSYTFLTLDR